MRPHVNPSLASRAKLGSGNGRVRPSRKCVAGYHQKPPRGRDTMGVQYTLFLLAHLAAVAVGVYVIRGLPKRVASTSLQFSIVLPLSAAVAIFAFVISDPQGIYRFRDIDRAYYAAGLAVLDSPAALT